MERHHQFASLLLGTLVFLACADGTPEEGGAEAAEAPAEMADAAAASGAQEAELSCFLRGATEQEAAENRASPLREVRFTYDGGQGLLCYGAPSARGREIMGGLVPYGQPWRSGANEPTTIHLTGPATIGSIEVEPGSYSIYTIPGEDEWQVVVNSSFERWGIPINEEVRANDIGTFTVTPETTEETVETLTYRYEDGAIVLEWENTRIGFPMG